MSRPTNPIFQRALNELRTHPLLTFDRLGIGSLLLARDMRGGLSITRQTDGHRNTAIIGNRAGSLSALVRHSLAVFVSASGTYHLTEAGLTWLSQVETKTRVFAILAEDKATAATLQAAA